MKKAPRKTQTLRALGVVRRSQTFSRRRPASRGRRTAGPKFNQLEMVTILHLQTQFGEDRCTQFRVVVVTDPHTHTHKQTNPQTGPITIHCAAKLSAQCNKKHHSRSANRRQSRPFSIQSISIANVRLPGAPKKYPLMNFSNFFQEL